MGVIHFRNWIPALGALKVEMAPIWAAWFWPILAYAGFEIVMHVVALARPGAARLNAGLGLARALGGTVIVASILRDADQWLLVSSARLTPDALASAQAGFNSGMRLGLACTVGVFVIMDAVEAWRLWQAMRVTRGTISARTAEPAR